MNKHERLQELELADGIVCRPGSLLTLFTKDANTDMGLRNHIDIIGAITDGQGDLLGEASLNHVDNISLLLRRNSAGKHNVDVIRAL